MGEIRKREIKEFLEDQKSALNTFRTLILFGKNTATYKFAFCHALMKQQPKSTILYSDLRDDFLNELVSHYKGNTHQFNKGANRLTHSMDQYLQSDRSATDWSELMEVAEGNIYNNVFDAFQNVGNGTLDDKFKLFEHHKDKRQLVLTDHTLSILENQAVIQSITLENQSRWRIVEEAWKANLSPNLLVFNEADNTFDSLSETGRVNLRSAVDVLMPYQRGRCFYCHRPLDRCAQKEDDSFPDVDHFFPLVLLMGHPDLQVNPNGVWNLVIACKSCNRGNDGKFDATAHKLYFDNLLRRNVLFVEEHRHSLRNSIYLSLNALNKHDVTSNMQGVFSRFEIFKGWLPKTTFPEDAIV